MTPQDKFAKQLEMFQKLETMVRETRYPSHDGPEAWRDDDQEPSTEETLLRLQVIGNGFLTLISQQLFWLQEQSPASDQEPPK